VEIGCAESISMSEDDLLDAISKAGKPGSPLYLKEVNSSMYVTRITERDTFHG
jgi:hypothetical protein